MGAPRFQERPGQEVHFWVRAAESDPPQTPVDRPPTSQRTDPASDGVRSPFIQSGLTSPNTPRFPPYTQKKTKTSRLPSSSADSCTISAHLVLISPPENQNNTKTRGSGRSQSSGWPLWRPVSHDWHLIHVMMRHFWNNSSNPLQHVDTYMDANHPARMLIVTDAV